MPGAGRGGGERGEGEREGRRGGGEGKDKTDFESPLGPDTPSAPCQAPGSLPRVHRLSLKTMELIPETLTRFPPPRNTRGAVLSPW